MIDRYLTKLAPVLCEDIEVLTPGLEPRTILHCATDVVDNLLHIPKFEPENDNLGMRVRVK
jgi:hypothetical protein